MNAARMAVSPSGVRGQIVALGRRRAAPSGAVPLRTVYDGANPPKSPSAGDDPAPIVVPPGLPPVPSPIPTVTAAPPTATQAIVASSPVAPPAPPPATLVTPSGAPMVSAGPVVGSSSPRWGSTSSSASSEAAAAPSPAAPVKLDVPAPVNDAAKALGVPVSVLAIGGVVLVGGVLYFVMRRK